MPNTTDTNTDGTEAGDQANNYSGGETELTLDAVQTSYAIAQVALSHASSDVIVAAALLAISSGDPERIANVRENLAVSLARKIENGEAALARSREKLRERRERIAALALSMNLKPDTVEAFLLKLDGEDAPMMDAMAKAEQTIALAKAIAEPELAEVSKANG